MNCLIGAFGNVKYAYLKKKNDCKFAIKAMKKKEIIESKHVDHIENEKKILELLEHPFIVSARQISLRHLTILLNYCSWITLVSCRTTCTSIS